MNNRYVRAATTLQQWLERGILKADSTPAIYLHDHYFEFGGERIRKRGIIARLRLEEWGRGVILPHEETASEAKVDRLNLLRACHTNLSAVSLLYDDPGQRIATTLALQEEQEPVISLTAGRGESHRVWAITEPEVIHRIASSLAPQPLYIVDGHHRYETALVYQRERRAYSSGEASDFIMATLTDSANPGIIILPIHRLVRGLPASTLEGLKGELEAFFELQPFSFDGADPLRSINSFLSRMQRQDDPQSLLGIFGLETSCLYFLRLRDIRVIETEIPEHRFEAHRGLGVSIFNHIVKGKLLGGVSQQGGGEAGFTYSHDTIDAVKRVLSGEYQLLFLLNPLAFNIIRVIAQGGERLPGKSTYFYPKQPTGLVINPLEGG